MLASDEGDGALEALKFSLASDIVELVVLTGDEAFLQTMREAVGSARRLWHVLQPDKVSDLLVAGEVGIVVIDAPHLTTSAGIFVSQISRQFPDLVVVVAGNRDDETALAGLISAGTVYRFIHKPMSPARARLFAEAAVRKYGEHRRRAAAAPIKHLASKSSLRWGIVGGGVGAMAVVALVAWALYSGSSDTSAPTRTHTAQVTASGDTALLARAAAAMAANRLTEPAGDNALELYLQAQARYPTDPQARAGLLEVHERLLARAENALLEERLDEAALAIETARKSGVESGRIAFLTAQLGKSRELLRAGQTQAATPTPTHARNELKMTEDHSVQPDPVDPQAADASALEANRILEEQLAAARAKADTDAWNQLLQKADERLQQDRLIEPANDSAKYYLLTLRTLNPGNPGLTAAFQDLGQRLIAKSKRALSLQQLDAARSWLEETAAIGYSSAESATMQSELDSRLAQQRFLSNIIASSQLTLLKSAQPVYPTKAAASKLQGWVELDFTVAESGEVRDIAVHGSSNPGLFDEAAIKAVSQWRYQPILQDGKPTKVRSRVRIRFTDPT